jgi:predicted aldo/keto reductase-like oxidoreductase
MQYRRLGKSDCEVSVLGFGCMRLPMLGSSSAVDRFDPKKAIDEEEATRMIHYAIDHGINYFDTAYVYHGGKSETLLGKALKAHRDGVMIATKLPTWLAQTPDDFDRFLDEQLKKLETEYMDLYLLHGLNRAVWQRMMEMDVLGFLDKALSDGRVRYAGFSFHDDVKIFKEIIDSYPWTLCQIQYNYFDENYQAGREGLEYAAAKGIGVVVMEPLRGGKLTDKIPEEIQALWESAQTRRTPAEWALKWVWNHEEVSIALSGMSAMSQLVENIKIAEDAYAGSLSEEELKLVRKVRESYRRMLKIDCTGCAYCMPCPSGVNVPLNLSLYNDMFMFKDSEVNLHIYNHMISPEQRASNCSECGECEEQCPQHISIREELKNVHKRLGQTGG